MVMANFHLLKPVISVFLTTLLKLRLEPRVILSVLRCLIRLKITDWLLLRILPAETLTGIMNIFMIRLQGRCSR